MGENQELEKQRDIAMRICREHDIAWDEDLDVPTLNGEPVTAKTVSDVFCENGTYIKLEDLAQYPIRKDHYDKKHGNKHFIHGVESVLEYAANLPVADVAPVVHARWVHDGCRFDGGVDWFHCSACKKPESGVYVSKPYCSNCGAKMDGVE